MKGKKQDHDGKLIGTSNENPIINTALYNVENPDGHIAEYTANVIAEILYIQVEGYGYNYSILYEIARHRNTDDTIPMNSGYYDTRTGVKRRVILTK